MRNLFLFVLAVAFFSNPVDVLGRRHEFSVSHSHDPLRDKRPPRGPSLADITPENQNNTEVVAQVGGTASIKCYTHFIPDETVVTWLKRDSDQLLTAGGQVYSSEARYSVSHVRHQQLWELSVRDVKKTDGGVYECQLTTHPPTSLFFILKVVEARAVLQGGPDMHVQTGATLRLHCVLYHATEKPEFIFWYHNGSMINYAPRRPLKVLTHHYSSVLVISDVRWDDAGEYRCEPHNARPANLTLHVVAGEKHAALHNGQGEGDDHTSATTTTTTSTTLVASSWLVLILFQHFYGTDLAEGERDPASTPQKKKSNDNVNTVEEEAQEEKKMKIIVSCLQQRRENNGEREERRIMMMEGEKRKNNWRYS